MLPPKNLTNTILANSLFYDMHSNVSSCPRFCSFPPPKIPCPQNCGWLCGVPG